MIGQRGLSRREFLRTSGMASIGLQVEGLCPALESRPSCISTSDLAFVGVMGETPGILVYTRADDGWCPKQVIACDAPVSLALHPEGGTLYVLQELSEWEGLPRGSIETFRIETGTGKLTSLGRQGLSLSAILPRRLAVSPEGRCLAVAVYGGGAYNILPIQEDRGLGRATSIMKEVGCGPVMPHQASAHPHTVVFDPRGRMIASDMSCDRLTVFSRGDGLKTLSRYELPPGSGPQSIALHPSGTLLYVVNALSGSITGMRYDAEEGSIAEQLVQVGGSDGEALTLHPSGDFLYASEGNVIRAWRIEAVTGNLMEVGQSHWKTSTVHEMAAPPEGRSLIAVASDGILEIEIDPVTGSPGRTINVARVAAPRCIALSRTEGKTV